MIGRGWRNFEYGTLVGAGWRWLGLAIGQGW
jgi:hypothetical protein